MKKIEDSLLSCGYTKIDINFCDKNYYYADLFYQKIIDDYRGIYCYVYEIMNDKNKLEYDYEFELIENIKDKYWRKNHMHSINKNMALKEIENVLLAENYDK